MTGLLDLAERVEAATGPDRELDALVHCAIKDWQFSRLGGEFFGTTPDGERFTVGLPERLASDTSQTHHKMRSDSLAPRYTASLDAAMTLVPEGWYVAELAEHPDRDFGCVTLREAADEDHRANGDAATLALALCAAALRARANEVKP